MSQEKEHTDLQRVDPETQEKIMKAAREGRVEMASQDSVNELEPYVDEVLEALGHPEALVTDESTLSDFFDIFGSKEDREKEFQDFKERVGVDIGTDDPHEKIIVVAWRVKEARHAGYAASNGDSAK